MGITGLIGPIGPSYGTTGSTGPFGTTGPGTYQPGFNITHEDSTLSLHYDGGIYLSKGNWTNAAIGLRIELELKAKRDINILKFKLGDVAYDVLTKEISLDTSRNCMFNLNPKNEEKWKVSQENFPILLAHYNKIKEMKAFW